MPNFFRTVGTPLRPLRGNRSESKANLDSQNQILYRPRPQSIFSSKNNEVSNDTTVRCKDVNPGGFASKLLKAMVNGQNEKANLKEGPVTDKTNELKTGWPDGSKIEKDVEKEVNAQDYKNIEE